MVANQNCLPRAKDELSTQRCDVASVLEDGHAHSQRVPHDHGETSDLAVVNVLPFLCIGTGVVGAVCHAESFVHLKGRVSVKREWRAEDVCEASRE